MPKTPADNDARRTYWSKQMGLATEFMRAVLDYPVNECGEGFADLRKAVAEASVKVVFSDTKLVGAIDRIYWLRESLVWDLVAVAREMNQRNWVLKIEDGYRSVDIQQQLGFKENVFDVILERVVWECGGKVPSAELMFRRLSGLVAASAKVGTHISGTAVDISVLSGTEAASQAELDRGGPYLELSELTPMASPFVSEKAARNRREITAALAAHGFVAYPYEFWHYSKGDVYDQYLNDPGTPARFGPVHFDQATGRIEPVEQPESPLHSLEAMQERIERAVAGRNG